MHMLERNYIQIQITVFLNKLLYVKYDVKTSTEENLYLHFFRNELGLGQRIFMIQSTSATDWK